MNEQEQITTEEETRGIQNGIYPKKCDSLLIGSVAPDFIAESSCGKISLSSYKGRWLVFFSHPR